MAILWSNNASSSISGSITATDTSVALAAGTGIEFPIPTGGDYYIATFYDQATKTRNEIVHVTHMAGDVATIVRGQEGTTPQAWNAGDIFANLITAGTLRAFVQAGTGPADTSIVYVGTDTGTVNHIVATTNPVPAAYAVGMLFNIKVANGNTGATDVQLNGKPALALTRNNGAALVGGDLTASEEVTFVYNGTNFNTMIPDLRQHPPVTTFYVRPDGNDNNTGWADTPQDAFLTIYGAINQISARYSSQDTIVVKVADGHYNGGAVIKGAYIAAWDIVGNVANPSACVWDATTASPPPGAFGGSCALVGPGGFAYISGFMLRSWGFNLNAGGGHMELSNLYLTSTIDGTPPLYAGGGGSIFMDETMTFDVLGGAVAALILSGGGYIGIGQYNAPPWPSYPCTIHIVGNPTIGSTLEAANNGVITVSQVASWTGGTPIGQQYHIWAGGGIDTRGNTTGIPGTLPGVINPPGWIA